MPRIKCRQPSTGKPIWIDVPALGTAWVTLAEAPDFSVFDPGASEYTARDPLDALYGLAAGEVFLIRPLFARNLLGVTTWVEFRFLRESGSSNDAPARYDVPAGETVLVAVQGFSLLKRSFAAANGDRLQARAQTANSFAIAGTVQERLVAEHIGVET